MNVCPPSVRPIADLGQCSLPPLSQLSTLLQAKYAGRGMLRIGQVEQQVAGEVLSDGIHDRKARCLRGTLKEVYLYFATMDIEL